MSLTEAFLYLFFDSFFSALILPIREEFIYKVMLTESKYAVSYIYIVAVLGNSMGAIVNFFIGKYIYFLGKKGVFTIPPTYDKISFYFRKYCAVPLLLIPSMVLNNIFSLIAGFFKFGIYSFLLVTLIMRLGKYYYLIYG